MKKLFAFMLVVCIIAIATFSLCACDNKNNDVGFVRTSGTQILDGRGNPIGLYGTNFGGWLVQEEWLVPTEVSGDYGQIDMMLELANRFGKDGMERLIKVYEDNWITETDFQNIKNMGLNCVRVPFSYMNIMDVVMLDEATNTYIRTPFEDLQIKSNGFDRLDWTLQMCEKYQIYAILDLHGAVGSQSGNDHTGDIAFANGGQLWLENEIGETCRAKTLELWQALAQRYKDNKWIAMYDLMNEPGIKNNGSQTTTTRTHQYFDELYKAIRAIDSNHIITMESCWTSGDLPLPEVYGWENVVYQYHHYNWASGGVKNSTYYGGLVLMNTLKKHNVPILVGEFNVWGDSHQDKINATGIQYTQTEEEAWDGVMELYCGLGWNFTTWNYKHAAEYSSWGLYNLKKNNADLHQQADFKNMSEEEIATCWARHNAEAYEPNTWLVETVKKHIANFNTNGSYYGKLGDLPYYSILENGTVDDIEE